MERSFQGRSSGKCLGRRSVCRSYAAQFPLYLIAHTDRRQAILKYKAEGPPEKKGLLHSQILSTLLASHQMEGLSTELDLSASIQSNLAVKLMLKAYEASPVGTHLFLFSCNGLTLEGRPNCNQRYHRPPVHGLHLRSSRSIQGVERPIIQSSGTLEKCRPLPAPRGYQRHDRETPKMWKALARTRAALLRHPCRYSFAFQAQGTQF